jgi:Ca2+-binding RTX toxin-like protein
LRRKQSFSVGSELSETLTGSSFNDQIIGLGGRDTMLGNGGSDTFVYLQASESPQGSTNRDRVLDFGSDDWLDLSNIQSNCSTVQFATLAVATNNIAGCTVATYQNSSNTLTFVIGNFTPSFGAAGLQIELAGSHAIQVGQNLILDRNRSALQSYVDTGDPFLN